MNLNALFDADLHNMFFTVCCRENNNQLVYVILAVWTWSMLQFPFQLAGLWSSICFFNIPPSQMFLWKAAKWPIKWFSLPQVIGGGSCCSVKFQFDAQILQMFHPAPSKVFSYPWSSHKLAVWDVTQCSVTALQSFLDQQHVFLLCYALCMLSFEEWELWQLHEFKHYQIP